jgi:hypothetical protein
MSVTLEVVTDNPFPDIHSMDILDAEPGFDCLSL